MVDSVMATPGRFGQLFTQFGGWQLRTTAEFIQECLPNPQPPLIHLVGFHVSMLHLGPVFSCVVNFPKYLYFLF